MIIDSLIILFKNYEPLQDISCETLFVIIHSFDVQKKQNLSLIFHLQNKIPVTTVSL